MFHRHLRCFSTWLRLSLEGTRKVIPGEQCIQSLCCARYTKAAPYVRWPHLGKCGVPLTPSLQSDLCPPPTSGKPHISVSGEVTEHPCSASSGATEPGFLPGSALPRETFQLRHVAAQSCERDFISPTSLLQHTHCQYIDKGSGSGNQTALDPTWIKKPKTGDPKSEVFDYISFGLIKYVGRHGRSNMNHPRWQVLMGTRGGGTSSGNRVPLSYSHQLALYA